MTNPLARSPQTNADRWRLLENLFDAAMIISQDRILHYGNHRFRVLSQTNESGPIEGSEIKRFLQLPEECWQPLTHFQAEAGTETPQLRSIPFEFSSGTKGFAQLIIDKLPAEGSDENLYLCVLRDVTFEVQSKSQLDKNERLISELRRSHAEAHFLWRLSMETPIYLEPSAVLSMVVKKLREDLGFADACFLQIPTEEGGTPEPLLNDPRIGSRIREVARSINPRLKLKQSRTDVFSVDYEPYGTFWVTYFRPKLEKPFFLLARSEPTVEQQNRRAFLEPFAMQMTAWLDNRALYLSSITDALTGVFNRRHFDSRFAVECLLARERRMILSLLLIDVDHFKKINDTYGHAAGDAVLKVLGEILKAIGRTTDIPARVGGEEFALLLFDTSPEDALVVAEKLRKKLAETAIRLPGTENEIRITVSCGISGFIGAQATPENVYAAADAALYKAKNEGRNRSVLSDVKGAP